MGAHDAAIAAGQQGTLNLLGEDAVAADLTSLQKMIADSDDLRRLMNSPILGRDEQTKAIAAVASVIVSLLRMVPPR